MADERSAKHDSKGTKLDAEQMLRGMADERSAKRSSKGTKLDGERDDGGEKKAMGCGGHSRLDSRP